MNPLSLIGSLMPRASQPEALPLHPGRGIPLTELEKAAGVQGTQPAAAPSSFENVLGKLVNEVNNKQVESGNSVRELMAGGDISLHQVMIAKEEAGVAFQLMVEVRNKLLESYQELMKMQL